MDILGIDFTKRKTGLSAVVKIIKNGGILVLPTDTVYGLACDAANKKAVENIYEIKKRDKSKPLAVFVKDIKMAKKYAVVKKEQEEFLKKNWPGAVTVVLPAKKGLSPLVYKNKTIALRQPNNQLVLEIISLLKKPLAQTSANISNQPATTRIKDIIKVFSEEEVSIVDAGNLIKNKPSAIIDLTSNNKIIRN
jgi:L-threonylcarbamoyladenylate synthase